MAALISCALALAPAAHAADAVGQVATTFKASTLTTAGGVAFACPTWSGGTDGEGLTYLPCNKTIEVVDGTGRTVISIPLPGDFAALRDAAPTHDGRMVYFVNGNKRLDNVTDERAIEPEIGTVRRMVRSSNGTWFLDPTFKINARTYGMYYWSHKNLAVDRAGHIYATANEYVYEYAANGDELSSFGGDRPYIGGVYQGGLELAEGIDVTPNGLHVYVVEQRWNHVQRWDRMSLTAPWYHSNFILGGKDGFYNGTDDIGNPRRGSGCDENGRTMSSPYDVGLDGGGNIFVLDVTCRRVLRFATDGTFRNVVWRNYYDGAPKWHGFTVNYAGTMTIPEQGYGYDYTGNFTSCAPDYDAPVFTKVVYPKITSNRTVQIGIGARDNCSQLAGMRTSGMITSTKLWGKVAGTKTVILTACMGEKRVKIWLRDGYGRLSSYQIKIQLRPPPPTVRTNVDLYGQGSYCVADPMSKLAEPEKWRLVDRCAAVIGTVLSATKNGSNTTLRIRLTQYYTDKIFLNAQGPLQMSVIGSSSTKSGNPIHIGDSITATGALITNPARSVAFMAPTGYWSSR